ncbi:MAG: serine protease [Candidatus Bipolaricaulota bacterium]|nr:serine protease [Candidatus Bipolaricaulota bacterium]
MPEGEIPLEEEVPERPRPRRWWIPAVALLVAGTLLALLIPGLLPREGTGSGTGFVVGDGYVLTAAHVVEGAREIAVYREGRRYPATSVAVNPGEDLALLRVEGLPSLSPLPWAPGSVVGERGVAVGYPHGSSQPVARWTAVAGVGGSGARGAVYTTDPFAKGSSGAPLVNASGHVVGIVTGNVASGGDEFGVATPASRAAAWLRSLGVPVEISLAGDPLPPAEVEARTRASVLRVEARLPPGAR